MSVVVPPEVQQAGDQAVAIYRKAIGNGESPRFAEMLALRTPPRSSGTDTTLFDESATIRKAIRNKLHRQRLQQNARRMGITLTGNEIYQASLAKFHMDPRACISQAEGRTKIRKMAEANGAGAEGAVTVKAREPEDEPKPKHRLHPQIVKRLVRQEMANPANAHVDRRELVEKVIDKHARKRK